MRTEFLHYTALGRVAKSDRSLPLPNPAFFSIAEASLESQITQFGALLPQKAGTTPPRLGNHRVPKLAMASAIAIKRSRPAQLSGPALLKNQRSLCDQQSHFRILVTRPEPTVRPPSRIAKPRPGSMAMGWIS